MVKRAAAWPLARSFLMGGSLLLCENLSVGPGGQADKAAEIVGEVALVGKAGPQGRLSGRDALLQQLLRLADPQALQVVVGRDPFLPGEGPEKGRLAQPRLPGHPLQGDPLPTVLLHKSAGPLHRLPPGGRRGLEGLAAEPQQPGEQEQQPLLLAELPGTVHDLPVEGPEIPGGLRVGNHVPGEDRKRPPSRQLPGQIQHGLPGNVEAPVVRGRAVFGAGVEVPGIVKDEVSLFQGIPHIPANQKPLPIRDVADYVVLVEMLGEGAAVEAVRLQAQLLVVDRRTGLVFHRLLPPFLRLIIAPFPSNGL